MKKGLFNLLNFRLIRHLSGCGGFRLVFGSTVAFLPLIFSLCLMNSAQAQKAQDNWYFWQTWPLAGQNSATNGGLSSPYGVAIGPDGRVYVGDQGLEMVQVYLPNGVYSFSITNGFGGGQSFSKPRGMVTDKAGNLYVADQGNNCVYEFTGNGALSKNSVPALGQVTGN